MGVEIELKYALPREARFGLAALLTTLPKLQAQKQAVRRLRNVYFDTPALTLQRRRIALRLRWAGHRRLQTVKTANPARGGLSVRNEWECPAPPSGFTFGGINDLELRHCLEQAAPSLSPAFRTDFRRQTWWLRPRPGACVELALDSGWIVSKDRRRRIDEIELELLKGNLADLRRCAHLLRARLPLRPLSASKAERGYRLLCQGA